MKKLFLFVAFASSLLSVGCGKESREMKKDRAAQVVTDFYTHIQNHEYDSAMLCTNMAEDQAVQMADLFEQLGMEIHDFRVDSVALEKGDTSAFVHVSLRVSNIFAPDTAETTPAIPCLKTSDGWRVKFDF